VGAEGKRGCGPPLAGRFTGVLTEAKMPRTNKLRSLWWLVLGLYLVSFFLPAFDEVLGPGAIGAVAFFWAPLGGFIAIVGGQHIPANPGFGLLLLLTWFANPLVWIGARLLARASWQRAGWAGTLALLVGSAIGLVWLAERAQNQPQAHAHRAPSMTIVHPDGSKAVVESAPSRVSNVWWHNLGYYVWLLSMAVLAATGWIGTWLYLPVEQRAPFHEANQIF
jgi:hypothetical protein